MHPNMLIFNANDLAIVLINELFYFRKCALKVKKNEAIVKKALTLTKFFWKKSSSKRKQRRKVKYRVNMCACACACV